MYCLHVGVHHTLETNETASFKTTIRPIAEFLGSVFSFSRGCSTSRRGVFKRKSTCIVLAPPPLMRKVLFSLARHVWRRKRKRGMHAALQSHGLLTRSKDSRSTRASGWGSAALAFENLDFEDQGLSFCYSKMFARLDVLGTLGLRLNRVGTTAPSAAKTSTLVC